MSAMGPSMPTAWGHRWPPFPKMVGNARYVHKCLTLCTLLLSKLQNSYLSKVVEVMKFLFFKKILLDLLTGHSGLVLTWLENKQIIDALYTTFKKSVNEKPESFQSQNMSQAFQWKEKHMPKCK